MFRDRLLGRFFARVRPLERLALVLLSAFWIAAAEAQIVPRLVIERPAEQPVRLSAAKVDVQIVGSVAVSNVELTIHNPNSRVLEGSLEFPLLDGQTVIGFASEVNGALREAVAIEKAKGRQVFDDVVRSQIDPALLEKTAGNNYKLRVYPIRAQGNTRLQIRLMETLRPHNGGLVFRLPLGFASGLAKLDLAIRVADPGAAPKLTTQGLGTVALKPAGRFYELTVERQQIGKEALVTLQLPETAEPRVVTQTQGESTYFYAELPVKPLAAPRPLPKKLALVWDASASGLNRRRADEITLLRRYLQQLGQVEVSLHVLRDALDAPKRFVIKDGDSSALRAELDRQPYDGGTNLALLAVIPEADVMLLFSDGIDNFGDGKLAPPKMPVLAVTSALQSDVLRLRHLASQSGGTLVELGEADAAPALAALLAQTPTAIVGDSSGLADVVIAPLGGHDTRLRVAGRIIGRGAELQLELAGLTQPRLSLAATAFAQAATSPYAARLWAQIKVDALAAERDLRRAEILRIAKDHALVTSETSLIVLERIEDYVHHEILPPAELRAEYEAARRAAQASKAAEIRQQSEALLGAWTARQTWWGKAFPKDTPPAPATPVAKATRLEAAARGDAAEQARAMARMRDEALMRQNMAGAREQAMASRASQPEVAAAAPAALPVPSPAALGFDGGSVAPGGKPTVEPQVGVQIKKWRSDAPWVRRLADAKQAELYALYLDERPNNANSPAFFIEVADLLAERKQPALALRVLSNLAEMRLENRDLLRLLASRLMQAGHPQLAVPILRRVLDIAPDEPHSLRDLALALADAGQPQDATRLLIELVNRDWDQRFGDIEEIALAELNALITRHPKLDTRSLDPRLIGKLPVELRIVLSWDSDNTDVDLWVIDPNGEKVFFSHPLSYQGGRLSRDVTGSYGPEEFILKAPKPGKYQIHANFYGHRQQVISSGTTVEAQITTGFGMPRQKLERALLRLKEQKETALVAEITVR